MSDDELASMAALLEPRFVDSEGITAVLAQLRHVAQKPSPSRTARRKRR
jgi:hypothetical protein